MDALSESERRTTLEVIKTYRDKLSKNTYRLSITYITLLVITFIIVQNIQLDLTVYGFQLSSLFKLKELIFVVASGLYAYGALIHVRETILDRVLLMRSETSKRVTDYMIFPAHTDFFFKVTEDIWAPRSVTRAFVYSCAAGIIGLLLVVFIVINIVAYIYFSVVFLQAPTFSMWMTVFLVVCADALFVGSSLVVMSMSLRFRHLVEPLFSKAEIARKRGAEVERSFWFNIGRREFRYKNMFMRRRGVENWP